MGKFWYYVGVGWVMGLEGVSGEMGGELPIGRCLLLSG